MSCHSCGRHSYGRSPQFRGSTPEGFGYLYPEDLVNIILPSMDFSFFLRQDEVRHLHNLVHTCIQGTWLDVASSPADPLFFLHHSFVEKIYDMWMMKRGRKPSPDEIPAEGKPGHARGDPIVPFFPVESLESYHRPLSDFGVIYDNLVAGTFKMEVRQELRVRRATMQRISQYC